MKDYLAGLLTRAMLVTIMGASIVVPSLLIGLRGVELQLVLIGVGLLAVWCLATFTVEWFIWGSPLRKEGPKH